MTTAFDTLKYVETLKAAGVPEEQAKAHVKLQADIADNTLATKADLMEVKRDLKQDIRELELKMTIKLGGMLVLAVGIILAGVK